MESSNGMEKDAASTAINIHHLSNGLSSHSAQQDNIGTPTFVLQPKGTWLHAGYHLTSATAGPALLSLPFSMTYLGWGPGLVSILLGAAISFYSYCLLSTVLDHLDRQGKRIVGFRDLSHHVLGPKWSSYLVAPLQFTICFVTVIGSVLVGGVSIKGIYKAYDSSSTLKLYEFIIMFGTITAALAQVPTFHSLRHINFISLLLCFGYSICATSGSIIAGYSGKAPDRDYSVTGTPVHKVFGVFGSLSIIANTYGNALVAEVQATVAPPVRGKMIKGLSLCYGVVLSTFISVAVSGYWAFGSEAESNIFANMYSEKLHLIPRRLYVAAYAFVFLQLVAISVVYLQPAFEVLEAKFADAKKGRFSIRNFIPRLLGRSFFVAVATFFAAMLPFFGDINAIMGALGYTPLVFVFPLLFFIKVFKPSKTSIVFWFNWTIVIVFSLLTILGCLAAFGQLILDANKFKPFADI